MLGATRARTSSLEDAIALLEGLKKMKIREGKGGELFAVPIFFDLTAEKQIHAIKILSEHASALSVSHIRDFIERTLVILRDPSLNVKVPHISQLYLEQFEHKVKSFEYSELLNHSIHLMEAENGKYTRENPLSQAQELIKVQTLLNSEGENELQQEEKDGEDEVIYESSIEVQKNCSGLFRSLFFVKPKIQQKLREVFSQQVNDSETIKISQQEPGFASSIEREEVSLNTKLYPIRAVFYDIILASTQEVHEPKPSTIAFLEWLLSHASTSIQPQKCRLTNAADVCHIVSILLNMWTSGSCAIDLSNCQNEKCSSIAKVLHEQIQTILDDTSHNTARITQLTQLLSGLGLISNLLSTPSHDLFMSIEKEIKRSHRTEDEKQTDPFSMTRACGMLLGIHEKDRESSAEQRRILASLIPQVLSEDFGNSNEDKDSSLIDKVKASWVHKPEDVAISLLCIGSILCVLFPLRLFDSAQPEAILILRTLISPALGLVANRPADRRFVNLIVRLIRGTAKRPIYPALILLSSTIRPFVVRGTLSLVGPNQAELITSIISHPEFGLLSNNRDALLGALQIRSIESMDDGSIQESTAMLAIQLLGQDPPMNLLSKNSLGSSLPFTKGIFMLDVLSMVSDFIMAIHIISFANPCNLLKTSENKIPNVQLEDILIENYFTSSLDLDQKSDATADELQIHRFHVSFPLLGVFVKLLPLVPKFHSQQTQKCLIQLCPGSFDMIRMVYSHLSIQRDGELSPPHLSVLTKCLQLTIMYADKGEKLKDEWLIKVIKDSIVHLLGSDLSKQMILRLLNSGEAASADRLPSKLGTNIKPSAPLRVKPKKFVL